MTRDLTAVRQEVNNLDSSVVVQELDLAMNLALYGLLWSLGNQYIVGSLSWRSLTNTQQIRRLDSRMHRPICVFLVLHGNIRFLYNCRLT